MKQIVKYRYLIALILFAVLVLCKVNGSSIGSWKAFIPSSYSKTELAGKARLIRSDEWSTQTPYFLAQANSKTPYSVVNPNISMSGQNMIVSYGAPVWDISTLAKPLNWGFLLFGPSYGLAWYWNMKIILMVLLSYELCMILTRQNMPVSILGSFWVAYSPAVQWWFMQHVGDIVFYMEAVVVTFYYFLHFFDRRLLKIAFALLFGLACVGYALTVYPAIQIPLAYLGLRRITISWLTVTTLTRRKPCIPVIYEFINTHFITKLPSAVLATGLVIMSIFLLVNGIVLDTLIKANRQSYELKLTQYKEREKIRKMMFRHHDET